MNANRVTVKINFAGTKAQFNALVEASKAKYEGSNCNSFTGATGNVSVSCKDGDAVYNRNEVYQG